MDHPAVIGSGAPGTIAVRATEPADDLERFGAVHGPAEDTPRRRRSFVAVADGRIVGVTTGVERLRHPSHYHVSGAVDDAYLGRGVGSMLLDAVAAAMPERPLLVSVPSDLSRSRAFLAARGFVRVSRSWTGRINPDHALAAEVLPPGFRVESRDALDEQLIQLYDAIYEECHWWIAPAVRPPGEPAWIDLAGPLVPRTVTVALDPFDRPIGVTSLHSGPYAAGDVFMPPTAILHGGRRREGRTLMSHLVSETLDVARRLGMNRVVVEVDDSYVELSRVLGPVTAEGVRTVEQWANG